MTKLLTILLFLTACLGCQKEIECPYQNCGPKACIEGHSWVLPAGNIDPDPHRVFTPKNNAYHVYVHPDFAATFDSCMPINIKDSAGYYRVVSKGVYQYNGNESPYVQIGGTDQGWYQHEHSTYFFIMQRNEWNGIVDWFRPRW